jgi:hypothetical protein
MGQGQRKKKPTPAQVAAAMEAYSCGVARGTRFPLPDLGWIKSPGGDWTPVAGESFEIITPTRPPEERKAKGVGFDPLKF